MKGDPRILLGKRLRKLRKGKGWSQEQLALECGLDRTYIGGIEQGRRNVGLINICKLAEVLNVSPSKLLDFRGIKNN